VAGDECAGTYSELEEGKKDSSRARVIRLALSVATGVGKGQDNVNVYTAQISLVLMD